MFKEDLLKGKRILVTGGGSGLGKEMSRYFLKYGAEVLICGRRVGVLFWEALIFYLLFGGGSELILKISRPEAQLKGVDQESKRNAICHTIC